MDISKTMQSLEKNGYTVTFFDTGAEAGQYLREKIKGKTVAFGGSRTLAQLDLKAVLGENNTVYDPDHPEDGEDFISTAAKGRNADCFLLSANGLSETGEIVNMDAGGNRLTGSLFGPGKTWYVIGTNKITKTLEEAVWRVRNVAAPANCKRIGLRTPCVKDGICHDCNSPDRICQKLLINLKAGQYPPAEVILINEALGF